MLRLLLDEHISPQVAGGLRRRHREVVVYAMSEWHGGKFLGQDDQVFLRVAVSEHLTLVTYDQRTIRPLLKTWGEEGLSHGGVIFIDNKTIAPGDIGALVRSLSATVDQRHVEDWEDRIFYLDAEP